MAITKKPSKSADEFIDGAPDGKSAEFPRQIKTAGRKAIITLSIDHALLAKVDAWAKARGMSRAAAISFAVSNLFLSE
jgi:hypothetical protein